MQQRGNVTSVPKSATAVKDQPTQIVWHATIMFTIALMEWGNALLTASPDNCLSCQVRRCVFLHAKHGSILTSQPTHNAASSVGNATISVLRTALVRAQVKKSVSGSVSTMSRKASVLLIAVATT